MPLPKVSSTKFYVTAGVGTTFAAATISTVGDDIIFTLEKTKHEKMIEFLMTQQVPGSDPPMTFLELFEVTQKLTTEPKPKGKR